MNQDWKQLEAVEPQSPPPILRERIRVQVFSDIQPSMLRVSSKVLALHALAGGISLVVCPQFGVGPFGGDAGLMGFLMHWGWAACAIGCGSAFMIGTGALSAWLLTPDEKRVLARNSSWFFTGLAALSWAAFMAMANPMHEGSASMLEHLGHSSTAVAPYSVAWSMLWAMAGAAAARMAFQWTRWSGARG